MRQSEPKKERELIGLLSLNFDSWYYYFVIFHRPKLRENSHFTELQKATFKLVPFVPILFSYTVPPFQLWSKLLILTRPSNQMVTKKVSCVSGRMINASEQNSMLFYNLNHLLHWTILCQSRLIESVFIAILWLNYFNKKKRKVFFQSKRSECANSCL